MYGYRVRRCALCRHRAIIEFMDSHLDPGLRGALRDLFAPLGYEIRADNTCFLIGPGRSMPQAGRLSVSSDLSGGLWAEADTWGELSSHQRWFRQLEVLLQQSGYFVCQSGSVLLQPADQHAA